MLRRSEKVSLNTLAFDSTYKLIDDTLALGVNLTEVRPTVHLPRFFLHIYYHPVTYTGASPARVLPLSAWDSPCGTNISGQRHPLGSVLSSPCSSHFPACTPLSYTVGFFPFTSLPYCR